MFETGDFRRQLENAVARQAGQEGLKTHESDVITYLQNLALANEPELMKTEEKRRSPRGKSANRDSDVIDPSEIVDWVFDRDMYHKEPSDPKKLLRRGIIQS